MKIDENISLYIFTGVGGMTVAASGATAVTIRLLGSNRALYRLSIGLKPTLLSGRLSKAIDGVRTR